MKRWTKYCHIQTDCYMGCVGCIVANILKEETELLRWWERQQEEV